MADLDQLLAEAKQPTAAPCKYCDLTSDLTDDQHDQMDDLDAETAARVLTDYGRKISATPIRKHRAEQHARG